MATGDQKQKEDFFPLLCRFSLCAFAPLPSCNESGFSEEDPDGYKLHRSNEACRRDLAVIHDDETDPSADGFVGRDEFGRALCGRLESSLKSGDALRFRRSGFALKLRFMPLRINHIGVVLEILPVGAASP